MRHTKLTAGLGALIAVTAATTAVALPGGTAQKEKRVEQRQDRQARALGQKLGVDQARVKRALEQIRSERMAKAKDRRAAAVAKQLGVSTDTAKRALAEGKAARKATQGTPKEKGKAFRAAVAKVTGKSEADVRKAMKAVRKELREHRMNATK